MQSLARWVDFCSFLYLVSPLPLQRWGLGGPKRPSLTSCHTHTRHPKHVPEEEEYQRGSFCAPRVLSSTPQDPPTTNPENQRRPLEEQAILHPMRPHLVVTLWHHLMLLRSSSLAQNSTKVWQHGTKKDFVRLVYGVWVRGWVGVEIGWRLRATFFDFLYWYPGLVKLLLVHSHTCKSLSTCIHACSRKWCDTCIQDCKDCQN